MITIAIESSQVQAALTRLQARLGNLSPALHDVGQALIERTREGIYAGKDWRGEDFAPNRAATLARKKGTRPLIAHGDLASSKLHYSASADSVTLGASGVQSAVLQFGAKAGAFGVNKRGGKMPWGDISARPFMPIEGGANGPHSLPKAAQALVLTELADWLK
ncbi:phage virion morphogenesis protein [Rhodoferax sp.]|uniref:phage virion morphogenesis protein n=1 Tax=Rhodoferax sp. TaxID=50421 RepID=UPI002608C859|nr:phage virion morphogenesis protein [Rhodoferax sp.]MDD3938039.1 phage virion morphogenesis protein [Rhodoferax sp.]